MDYLLTHPDRVWPRAVEHLQLVGLALAFALLIALPLGWLISRVRPLTTPVLGVLGVIYTIPSLALFVLLIPITGLGPRTALIGLVAYAQLALVRNTAVAFTELDPSILEAARGMGMTARQQWWQVELPLALPVILTGVRIATLSLISLATVAAWIGAGGLGQILLNGVSQDNPPVIIAGVICVTIMALAADGLLRGLEWIVRRGPRRSQEPVAVDTAEAVPEHV